nr:myosuppressin [Carausius morosus]
MKQCSARVMLVWVLVAAASLAAALPPPQCNPSLLDEVPPRFRKICAALSTIHELSSAMEAYLVDDRSGLQFGRENTPLLDSGVKRQDVDHVFLRFGRRR